MKRLLMIAVLLLTSIGVFGTTETNAQEIRARIQIGQDRNENRDRRYRRDRRYDRRNDRFENRRVRYITRDVRYGYRKFRETYRVEYRYGRQYITLVSRVRVY